MRMRNLFVLMAFVVSLPACAQATAGAAGGTATASALTAAGSATPKELGQAPGVTPGPSLTPSATLYPSLTPRPTPTGLGPARTATPTPCAEAGGTVSLIHVPSDVLNYPIDAQVYLPPCYATSGEAYPVLYLIHGLHFTTTQWVNLGAPAAAARYRSTPQSFDVSLSGYCATAIRPIG